MEGKVEKPVRLDGEGGRGHGSPLHHSTTKIPKAGRGNWQACGGGGHHGGGVGTPAMFTTGRQAGRARQVGQVRQEGGEGEQEDQEWD